MDQLPLAVGIHEQITDRNTPSVFNAALQDAQFWDARSPSVEAQVREPLLNPKEMALPDESAAVAMLSAEPEYVEAFRQAFPAEEGLISMRTLSLAMGAFQRQLLTPGSALDRFIAGDVRALDSQQLAGLEVFLREGCASCHAGPLLGGQEIHLKDAYPDVRAGDRFEFRKQLGNTHKFKIAPLRNIARTAPYLHDGRYATLEDSLGGRSIAYMVREAGVRETVTLADGELAQLVAFMESLTAPAIAWGD